MSLGKRSVTWGDYRREAKERMNMWTRRAARKIIFLNITKWIYWIKFKFCMCANVDVYLPIMQINSIDPICPILYGSFTLLNKGRAVRYFLLNYYTGMGQISSILSPWIHTGVRICSEFCIPLAFGYRTIVGYISTHCIYWGTSIATNFSKCES